MLDNGIFADFHWDKNLRLEVYSKTQMSIQRSLNPKSKIQNQKSK